MFLKLQKYSVNLHFPVTPFIVSEIALHMNSSLPYFAATFKALSKLCVSFPSAIPADTPLIKADNTVILAADLQKSQKSHLQTQ